MESSAGQFKDNLKKQYTDALGAKSEAAPNLTLDYSKFASSIKEEDNDGLNLKGNDLEMVKGIVDIINKVKDQANKKEIAKSMIEDFKKQGIKFDYNKFLKMCKLNLDKKSETKEATGSGSSGAYSAPLFSGEEPDLNKIEAKEATTSGSVGAYETPAMWAKSTKKKDWGPSRKPQIPGGGFVKVKDKCTKFPYCNQGDINSLKITKNESVKEAIKKVSKKFKLSENIIVSILEHEYEKIKKSNK
jgi:hypothetical protein